MSEEVKEESKLEKATDKVVHNVEDGVDAVKETGKEVFDAAKDVMGGGAIPEAKKSMIMGIVGFALYWTGIGGIIFGVIARKNAKAANAKIAEDPQTYKKDMVKAKIGGIAGLIAVILGAIMTVMYIGMIIAGAAS